MDRSSFWLVIFFGALSLPSGSWSSSFTPPNFPQAIQDAPWIVRGIVGAKTPQWALARSGDKKIYTYIDLNVLEVLKGDLSTGNILVRTLGGKIGKVGLRVAGSAELNVGEEVVLLLRTGETGSSPVYEVQGMMMGKFNLRENHRGEQVLSGPGLSPPPGFDETEQTPMWTIEKLRQFVVRLKEDGSSTERDQPSQKSNVSNKAPNKVEDRIETDTGDIHSSHHSEDHVSSDRQVSDKALISVPKVDKNSKILGIVFVILALSIVGFFIVRLNKNKK